MTNEGKLFTVTVFEGTEDEVNAQWLQNRLQGVGGSDVGAIMGISPWRSPLEVWLEKTGREEAPDLSGNERIQMGVELEPVVMEMYRRRHPDRDVRPVNASLRSVARPWAQASLDGMVTDPVLGTGIFEAKTSSRMSEWQDGVPAHYLAQVMHYMSVTGWPFADVTALIGDHGIHYAEIRVMRDPDDIAAVDKAVDEFWQEFVLKDRMPTLVTALDSESRALHEMYKDVRGDLSPSEGEAAFDLLASEYRLVQDEVNALTKKKKTLSNGLKRVVGEYKGVLSDDYVVTWVRSPERDSGVRVKVRS
jgi:putative phage-type endonuclease